MPLFNRPDIAALEAKAAEIESEAQKSASSRITTIPRNAKKIGKGTYAYVYKYTLYKTDVALRKPIDDSESEEEVAHVPTSDLPDSPFLIKPYQSTDSNTEVLPLAISDLELDSICALRKTHGLSEEDVKWIFAQVVKAVEVLHKNGYAHLDIKPGNILLYSRYGKHVKLSDYDLTRKVDESGGAKMVVCKGSLEYYPPEAKHRSSSRVEYVPNAKACDVYMLGFLLRNLEFLRRVDRNKLNSDCRQMKKLEKLRYLEKMVLNNKLSSAMSDLATKLMSDDPEKRLPVHQIRDHEYFNGFDWGKIDNYDASDIYWGLDKVQESLVIELRNIVNKMQFVSEMDELDVHVKYHTLHALQKACDRLLKRTVKKHLRGDNDVSGILELVSSTCKTQTAGYTPPKQGSKCVIS